MHLASRLTRLEVTRPVGGPQARAANQEDVVCRGFGAGMRVRSHGRGGEASRPRRLQSLCGVAQTGDQVGSGCASVLKEGAVAGDPPGPARSWSISWLTATWCRRVSLGLAAVSHGSACLGEPEDVRSQLPRPSCLRLPPSSPWGRGP